MDSRYGGTSRPSDESFCMVEKSEWQNGGSKLMLLEEKKAILKECLLRNKKLLHVYEMQPQTYRIFVSRFQTFVSTANEICDHDLTNLKVNLLTILYQNLSHEEIRGIVLETKKELEALLNALC